MARYTIVFDSSQPQIAFAGQQVQQAVEDIGGQAIVSTIQAKGEGEAEVAAVRIIITTLEASQTKRLLEQGVLQPIASLAAQAYAIRWQRTDKTSSIWIVGGSRDGAMYGALDVADTLRTEKSLGRIGETEKKPFIANRGIKFNLPLDARTPSYSDNSDSAQQNIEAVWDIDFWQTFLDEMARHRFNVLSLWNLHPFPSLVKVPEYPDIALDDVKRTTRPIRATTTGLYMSTPETLQHLETVKRIAMEDKITFWREVMQYAHDRGISVYFITWNIFTYGTEGNRYGIDERQDNEVTIDYVRASVRALLLTYPLLAGIGVTAGENMQRLAAPYSDEQWLWRTYGEAVRDVKRVQPDRSIRFIHRAHWSSLDAVEANFANYPDTLDYSYKYSQAHMYSAERPPFMEQDGFLDRLPPERKTWLTIRNDDYYLFRWGDPAFARQYISNMPPAEWIAGFFMGADGYIWGKVFTSSDPNAAGQMFIHKMEYMFSIWGRLAYDPTLPDETFRRLLAFRFPDVSATLLFEAWTSASRILPLVTTFHWEGNVYDFQWYPEACFSHTVESKGFHTVRDFIDSKPMPGSGMISIPAYCAWLDAPKSQQAEPTVMGLTPIQVADDIEHYAERALSLVREMLHQLHKPLADQTLRETVADLEGMAWLGLYYADKIRGAVELCRLEMNGKPEHRERAVNCLERAASSWRTYAEQTSQRHVPQLLNRQGYDRVDLVLLQQEVERDIEMARRA